MTDEIWLAVVILGLNSMIDAPHSSSKLDIAQPGNHAGLGRTEVELALAAGRLVFLLDEHDVAAHAGPLEEEVDVVLVALGDERDRLLVAHRVLVDHDRQREALLALVGALAMSRAISLSFLSIQVVVYCLRRSWCSTLRPGDRQLGARRR